MYYPSLDLKLYREEDVQFDLSKNKKDVQFGWKFFGRCTQAKAQSRR